MNFYFSASQILDRLDAKQGSIKGLIAQLPEKDRKRTSALVIQTLKYKSVLNDLISESKLLKEERKKLTSTNLALVLVHDLLFSGGIQAGDGPIKQAILRHKTRLKAELQKMKIKRGVGSDGELANEGDERASKIPRYVRVNTLLCSMEEAEAHFVSRGFTLSQTSESESNTKTFTKDTHIPSLLLFHPKTSFQDDPFYQTGKLILQDKASCFPASILSPPTTPNAIVIDATAAPGNKTSHLSALMRGNGRLYAFEKDKRRFSTLETMLSKAGCPNVKPMNIDFLTTDPLDARFSPVSHILLDPSCSGSGIVNRLDYLVEQEQESDSDQEARLQKLASFQLMMIKHAMKFPNVKKIVYSTCSIHATENEHVVSTALKTQSPDSGGVKWKLAPKNEVLPTWPRRGVPEEMDSKLAESVVRCEPGEDRTNGFFVACFVRTDEDEDEDEEGLRKRKREHAEGDANDGSGPRKKKRKKKKTKTKTSELTT